MQRGTDSLAPREKEIAAQEAARQAAKAAKIVTVKQYGERVFMPGKLAGTIGEKALAENSRAYYQNALDRHIYPIIGERKCRRSHALSWKLCCWAN